MYIVSKNENAINVQAFNGVDIIYDLNKTLAELKIADQVFNLLAQTDSTINPILTTNNIISVFYAVCFSALSAQISR